MTEQEKWLIEEAKRKAETANKYQDKAFYLALAQFATEQAHRAALMRSEIDGRTWDHSAW
ncbi:hypothetical protein [Lacticaseibacillus hulanensis]|jgi:hypothetical protein|uniref:hypothetical protein n=1 Tax=Lacticaseibacillus hulanensis TaxID=2493111 RepID=UPI000FDAC8B7|nr:hypothetical protein [Lacticaseibacillus hulanensis]